MFSFHFCMNSELYLFHPSWFPIVLLIPASLCSLSFSLLCSLSLFFSFADTLLLQLAAVDPSPLIFTHIPQFLQPGAIPVPLYVHNLGYVLAD